jgi:hypothetical protein
VKSRGVTPFTTSSLDRGGQLHAPAVLHPGENAGNHLSGGWVGPRAGLDVLGDKKILRP